MLYPAVIIQHRRSKKVSSLMYINHLYYRIPIKFIHSLCRNCNALKNLHSRDDWRSGVSDLGAKATQRLFATKNLQLSQRLNTMAGKMPQYFKFAFKRSFHINYNNISTCLGAFNQRI